MMNLGRLAKADGEPIPLTEAGHDPSPRQVVTLAFLNGQLLDSLISEQLARSLCAETESSVVLVRLESRDGPGSMNDTVAPELYLNGEFHLPPQVRQTEAGFHSLTLFCARSEPPTPAGLDSMLSQLRRHFRHVLIQTVVDEPAASWLFELLVRSNLAYLFLKAASKDVYQLELVMREARARCRDGGVHVKSIGCLAEDEQIGGFDLLMQRVAGPVHLFVRECPRLDRGKETAFRTSAPSRFRADVGRLAREIGGCLVGLALSSGAAKGFAHIGVIQVLEESGIQVDVVAGSSMGAYVGSLWAHGCDGRELEKLARDLETRWAFLSLIDPTFPPHRGFLRGFAVKKRLMQTIGHERFADLARPLRVVAANLATLERVVFSSGEVATAVHASTAVPGICVPITIDGETYTDGGIVDPLPVDVLREMGVAKVIAVNVIPTPERIRHGMEAELELARHNPKPRRKFFGKSDPPDLRVSYFARGSMLEILLRSVQSGQIRMAETSCRQADVVLRPDIYDDRWLDYRHPAKFIALGRQAAERHLEEITSLVTRKEANHESKFTPNTLASVV
jgi:NTE family protein